jgi:7,8-dihydroneopterin aldolase/epimerase/oxygenase
MALLDTIRMKGIEFVGVHGATEMERIRHQRFAVDLVLYLPLAHAAKTDQIADAVDYRSLGHMVIRIGTTAKFHLLEALASAIADEVQDQWPHAKVVVTVKKLSPPVDFAVRRIEVTVRRKARQPAAAPVPAATKRSKRAR